ncbi:histidine phosphatase family protein [Duganella sp. CT11-25]|jgi:alpha-ribazole phosphatase|uniref:histidine phosphatase family protein n=1 Tax=unclassified Duganella TaxID=2636909 RepID=UPI0039B0B5AA
MQLILVRHPQPLVASGVCYGRTDLAVAPAQLEQTLAALRVSLPPGLPLYASPLRRCAELADRLSSAPIYDARLVEMDFGTWEMQPWDAIPRAGIDAWAEDVVHYQPGGGESVLQMAVRIAAFHADLQRQLGERSAIVVCHAGAMRLLSACHSGLAPVEMALHAAQAAHNIPYGSTLILPH